MPRTPIVVLFAALALTAAALMVGSGADDPSPAAPAAVGGADEPSGRVAAPSPPDPDARGAEGAPADPAAEDAAAEPPPPRDEPTVAGVVDAALVGVVYDLGRASNRTGPFEGATVEVREADSTFEERFAGDTLRGLDFDSASRRRPAGVLSSVADAAPTHVVRTDADGRFRVEGVSPNRWTSVRVVADGYVPFEVPRVFPAPEEVRDLGRIDLRRGGALAGRVVDEHGRAVPDAEVRLGEDVVAESDEEGAFEVRGLRSGVVTLRARRPGERSDLAPTEVVTVRTNDRVEGVRLLLPVGVEIAGAVLDRGGAPVAGAFVTARFEADGARRRPVETAVRTGDDGRFAVTGVPPDSTADLDVVHPSAPPVRLDDVRPGRPVTVTLETAPRLLVKIVQAGTGNALQPSRARWFVDSSSIGGGRPSRSAWLDGEVLSMLRVGEATYAFPIVRPGEADLVVDAPLHGPATLDDPLVVDGLRDVGPITLELTPAPAILGQVVEVGGAPIRGATVVHVDGEGRAVASGVSRSDGRFLLARAGDGGELVATAAGYARGSTGRLRDALLVLEPENRIVGTVIGFDGRPAVDLGLLVHGPNPSSGSSDAFVTRTRTDGAGEFVARALPSGSYRVHLTACASLAPGREVIPRGETRVDLDLRRSHGTLRGRVFVDDLPADGVLVRLSNRSTGRELEVSSAPGGTYRFPILPAGDYAMHVRRDGRPLGEVVPATILAGTHVERDVVVRTSSVSGVVAGLSDGPAVVRLTGGDGDRTLEDERMTDTAGSFRFVDLPAGEYRLSASAPGLVAAPRLFRVGPGANGPVTLRMVEATFAVLVPPEGTWTIEALEATPDGGEPARPRVRRHSDGALLLDALPVGRTRLEVRLEAADRDTRPRWLRRTLDVELAAGGPNRFPLADEN
ncbi:MAG: carboxypeptidase regulatory-like domain-containing protein [Planctomycetota bacterium JB042]